jgi:hypothetical protein
MTNLKMACLSAALAAFTLPVVAQSASGVSPTPIMRDPSINQRLENQQDRIGQGVESGQLTPRETSRLENREARIDREIRHDRRADGGRLTQSERAQINSQLNHTSRQIYRDKHNSWRQGR